MVEMLTLNIVPSNTKSLSAVALLNSDSIQSKIVDPSSDAFTIQFKLSDADNGTPTVRISYQIMGEITSVS